jgi:hypothetical protein
MWHLHEAGCRPTAQHAVKPTNNRWNSHTSGSHREGLNLHDTAQHCVVM